MVPGWRADRRAGSSSRRRQPARRRACSRGPAAGTPWRAAGPKPHASTSAPAVGSNAPSLRSATSRAQASTSRNGPGSACHVSAAARLKRHRSDLASQVLIWATTSSSAPWIARSTDSRARCLAATRRTLHVLPMVRPPNSCRWPPSGGGAASSDAGTSTRRVGRAAVARLTWAAPRRWPSRTRGDCRRPAPTPALRALHRDRLAGARRGWHPASSGRLRASRR